ncbi:MAG: sugar phosphate isomerase/epimerase [Bryobacteraceae bacterium]|nr:sugar phosphate isomerase/epimerase [Bryobacteraceae bacterium]
MSLQSFEEKRQRITETFCRRLAAEPGLHQAEIKLSWSNWGFGMEPLEASARRLERNGIRWIELHGNHYGKDLGYRPKEVLGILGRHGIEVSGICGMFSRENDLSSPSGLVRQAAIDYIRRQLELCREVNGSYLLVVPGAVGRPAPYDVSEFGRSVETLRLVADEFVAAGVRGAVEPIRSAEVSLVHTFEDVRRYLDAVGSPGIQHINGDIYHMQVEEANVAETIGGAGDRLINLHLADSNRCALGEGSMDVDAILMALYTIGYADGPRFATAEPLGPGGDPYPAMFGQPDPAALDELVRKTAICWREREAHIKTAAPAAVGA